MRTTEDLLPRVVRASIVVSLVFLSPVAPRLPRASAGDAQRVAEPPGAPIVSRVPTVLGVEIRVASRGAHRTPAVRESVGSMRETLRERSGLELGDAVAERLAVLEERTLRGELEPISVDDLSAVLAAVLLQRVRESTDAEIARARDVLLRNAGVNPSAARPTDRLWIRANGRGGMSADAFVSHVEGLRENLMTPQLLSMILGHARVGLHRELTDRAELFEAAAPHEWLGARDGMTPVQALVLTYSVASEDPLWFTRDELARVVDRLGDDSSLGVGGPPPSPRAFGPDGRIFSTPLDIALDERTLARVLDGLERRRQP